MSPIDAQIARLLAERHFPKYEASEWAVMCLEAGYDSRHLRMLAATVPNDWPSISGDIERRAMAELGWDAIAPHEYLLEYARSLAFDIIDGNIGTVEGSQRMYRLMYEGNLHDELSGWYEIDEILYSLGYFNQTGKKDHFYVEPQEFDSIVKEHCKNFLAATRPKTAPLPATGFDDAESTFREFLINNGHTGKIIWVFAEDMIRNFGEIDLYLLDPASNRKYAQRLYERGVETNLGVCLHAFANLNDELLAYVMVPADATDSEYRMMSKDFVKFSVHTELREQVREIKSPLVWSVKNLFTNDKKRVGFWSDVPFRKEIS